MMDNSISYKLSDFLAKLGVEISDNLANIQVKSLSQNSNNCNKDDLFVAVKGSKFHGIEFFKDARSRGVKFCLTSQISNEYPLESQILITDLESRLTEICIAFYQDINIANIVAVTGTNGKSSIIDLIYQIGSSLNFKCNSLGTIGFKNEHKETIASNLTSPDIFAFYNYLNISAENNIDIFAFEASSHGLSQKRIGAVKSDTAIFTNLSLDHLDYHDDMESYYQAKKLLFTNHIKENSHIIINIDDNYGNRLATELSNQNVIRISQKHEAEVKFHILSDHSFKLQILGKEVIIEHNFITNFQIVNYVTAIAYFTLHHQIKLDLFEQMALSLESIKGRMEIYEIPQKHAKIIIDFAHTPDAMKNVLKDLKSKTQNRLITVFGCGGDRDKTKRPIMGKLANEIADIAIVTDDNPRYEDPAIIRSEIMHGNKGLIEIDGRYEAILFGLENIKNGDILVILGKGHEEYQIVKDKKHVFSESDIIQNYLKEHYVHN
ncbi:MAG: UDP-N-acetylmuramoyl-L-alanyl-D-glutamate--2,6-diaminopimelate ligase [Rickettsiales bacterium]|nr:UDP-N-acetylmuramoyl-L-alanyl-D-glutamate--2,6-diaminopimelate ligase [Rickettsiales bacterium]